MSIGSQLFDEGYERGLAEGRAIVKAEREAERKAAGMAEMLAEVLEVEVKKHIIVLKEKILKIRDKEIIEKLLKIIVNAESISEVEEFLKDENTV